ncbi:HNH endonuclease [Salmonella enterica subsp. houtenae]|uniref:HNH endonuclease n=1 Tax=Salmonella houtenae TaxID=59205 RepID=A0A5Y2SA33_SALHO|nr:HNH endonuclease [Salmonella enterica subsp. houtenae]
MGLLTKGNNMKKLSIDEIRSLFSYNPDTGILTAINRTRRTDLNGKPVGCPHGNGYLDVRVGNKLYYVHRLCWAHYYGEFTDLIDHINGNKSDNRIANLRAANKKMNGLNRGIDKDNLSGFKGVTFRVDTKNYMWQFVIDGKRYTKSGFPTAEEAYNHKLKFIDALQHSVSDFLKP